MGTKGPSRSGKRKVKACDSCFRKKIKCYPTGLQCEWCTIHGLPCTFTRHVHYKPPQSPRAQSLHPSEQVYCPQIPNNVRTFNGLPFFSAESQSWMKSRTGEPVDLRRFCRLGPPWQRQRASGPEEMHTFFQIHHHVDLPDKGQLIQALSEYRLSPLMSKFPFIDEELLQHTIATAYHQNLSQSSPHVNSARACIFAFMAFCSHDKADQRQEHDQYTYEAQYLLPDITQGMATIDGIQALLILAVLRIILFGDVFSVDILLATASRFIFILGGHQYPGSNTDKSRYILHCRTLFWLTYAMDKELSLRTGRPPCLSDDQCDLTLPEIHDGVSDVPPAHGRQKRQQLDSPSNRSIPPLQLIYVTDLRLSIIQSRIYRELWSVPAQRKSDAELLQTIRELDVVIEDWEVQLPNPGDPRLSLTDKPPYDDNLRRFWLLRLQHLYCVAAIHQTSTGCAAWIQDREKQLPGINSSLMVAVEASRSTLRQFHERPFLIVKQSFWFNIFYIVSAAITLFCNILRTPVGPLVGEDISLLQEIADRLMTIEEPSDSLADRALIRDFVEELCRLAHCAVSRTS